MRANWIEVIEHIQNLYKQIKQKQAMDNKQHNLNLSKAELMQLHSDSNQQGKELLYKVKGKEFFIPGKITDRVKTIDDIIQLSNPSPDLYPILEYKGPNKLLIGARALTMLTLLAEVLNEGWEPDWTNGNQPKYFAWFDNYKSGVGFSYSDCAYWYTGTTVGSRLSFKSAELAEYAGKQFRDVYNQFLTK